jgi:hypothetical protein
MSQTVNLNFCVADVGDKRSLSGRMNQASSFSAHPPRGRVPVFMKVIRKVLSSAELILLERGTDESDFSDRVSD